MGKYLLKRILIFIPTLFVITLLSFTISLNSPGDPVERLLNAGEDQAQNADRSVSENQYLAKRKQLGLDLPVFYFSIASLAECDTLFRIPRPHERRMLSALTSEYGNWSSIQEYFISTNRLESLAFGINADSANREILTEIKISVSTLKRTAIKAEVSSLLSKIDTLANADAKMFASIHSASKDCMAKFAALETNATRWKNYVPSLHIFGFQNQYHKWISAILTGDFGISYQDRRPVLSSVLDALPWSLMMNFFAIIFAYSISVPLGIFSVVNRNTSRERAVTTFLFILYSLPAFWVATMMITFLCNPEYLNWFPTSGVMDDAHNASWSFSMKFADYAKHLFLPTLCYTYSSFAFLSRQMRAGMMEVITQDFIRTARAKGLGERPVIWKHALRNSLIPLITHFANIFPALVGGSVIIETIFSIPGMGRLGVMAIFSQDHPVIIAIFTIAAIMTLLGILVSDILYALVDPRISFSRK